MTDRRTTHSTQTQTVKDCFSKRKLSVKISVPYKLNEDGQQNCTPTNAIHRPLNKYHLLIQSPFPQNYIIILNFEPLHAHFIPSSAPKFVSSSPPVGETKFSIWMFTAHALSLLVAQMKSKRSSRNYVFFPLLPLRRRASLLS